MFPARTGFPKRWLPLLLAMAIFMVFYASAGRCAQQDEDLELIPDNVLSQTPEQAGAVAPEKYRVKIYLDEAAAVKCKRNDLPVPKPSGDVAAWDNRLSLDLRAEMDFLPNLSLVLADRLNHLLNDDRELSGGRLQNDLKEVYLTANSYGFLYFDLGRINFKNGVALGFNPTDYFKKNAVTYRVSEDPNVLRENRLGVLMVRGQGIWEKGALTLAFAPEVNHEPDYWWTDAGSYGLRLDRTNNCSRFFSKISLNAFEDFNPEILYFHDENRSHLGANLTKGIGDALIVYMEWSGSNRPDILGQSLKEARQDGTIPRSISGLVHFDEESHFQNQLALGFSYTEEVKRTTYLEYHFNEAGFSHDDWCRWFATGAKAQTLLQNPQTNALGRGMLGLLWITRKWSQEAQEPLSRHSLFVRTFWEDALFNSLDLTGLARINLSDGSFFSQPMAEYHLRKNLTLSLSANLFIGSRESEYGSLNPLGEIKAGLIYYF